MRPHDEKSKSALLGLAGFLYVCSLHKYVSRDGLSTQAGIQGILEFGFVLASSICVFIAVRGEKRRYGPSIAVICFGTFGIFAVASSWRSFSPPLSLAKGLLLFAVLAIGYLSSQTGLAIRFLRAVYWSYVGSLVIGLLLGLVMPSKFPLLSIDDFSGRTRLSVFNTFPGTMGETAAYLILLTPLLFTRSPWISRLFLILMNLAAGGKTSTLLLICLLGLEYLTKIRSSRSPRAVALVTMFSALLCFGLYSLLFSHADIGELLSRPLGMVYGHDVAAEATSLDGRVDLWRGALNLLGASPFLGYGFDGARVVILRIAAWSGSSHNAFLELGLSGGLVGLAIFIIGLGSVLHACWNAAEETRLYLWIIMIYMIPIAFTGITFNFPSYFGLLILIFAYYCASPQLQEVHRDSRRAVMNLSRPAFAYQEKRPWV